MLSNPLLPWGGFLTPPALRVAADSRIHSSISCTCGRSRRSRGRCAPRRDGVVLVSAFRICCINLSGGCPANRNAAIWPV